MSEPQSMQVTYHAGEIPQLARQYAIAESELIKRWRERIQILAGDGEIAIWGAGAKGVTFTNLVDAHRKHIACVVEGFDDFAENQRFEEGALEGTMPEDFLVSMAGQIRRETGVRGKELRRLDHALRCRPREGEKPEELPACLQYR